MTKTAAQTNVVTLRRRRGRPRKALSGHTSTVLAFTGKKRFVYDREDVLARHQQRMAKLLIDTWRKVEAGEITGVMICTSMGETNDGGHSTIGGVFRDRPAHAVDFAEHLLEYAQEMRDEADDA